MRRAAKKVPLNAEGGAALALRKFCYGSGVAYIPEEPGETCWSREKRHERMRLRARRTGRGPVWRDTCPMEARAVEVGVKLKEPAQGQEESDMRANKNTI